MNNLDSQSACPCDSSQKFINCCGPYISGEKAAPTAEALMRSRYSAYVVGNIDYIKKTLAPESQGDFDTVAAKKWARESTWKGLKILKVDKGSSADKTGTVEFVVTYTNNKVTLEHHEISTFRKNEKGEWLFLEGEAHTHKEGEGHDHHVKPQTIVRESPKVGRNDPCPCGSGKKFKKCCGA